MHASTDFSEFSQPFQVREVKGLFWEFREGLETLFWNWERVSYVKRKSKRKNLRKEKKDNPKRRFKETVEYQGKGGFRFVIGNYTLACCG